VRNFAHLRFANAHGRNNLLSFADLQTVYCRIKSHARQSNEAVPRSRHNELLAATAELLAATAADLQTATALAPRIRDF
jgi:hypothetical protein